MKGTYFDSVTLMTVAQALSAMDGILDAAVVMGTRENRAILRASDLLTEDIESARDTDLVIAVRAEDASSAGRALAAVDQHLEAARAGTSTDEALRPSSLEGALDIIPDANLAIISVAGRYAATEARRALDAGLHVMLFSDNVPVDAEHELKTVAHERGLLVMGPDCGTAVLNGIPLGFANAVSRGDIGIVAASGTGLQEVSCIISNEGAGISQAIGTGGRDVTAEIGGVSFLDALTALGEDDSTRVVVLVSKPPDGAVVDRIRSVAEACGKPVVEVFLGARSAGPDAADTLEEAALRAVALSKKEDLSEVAARIEARDRALRDRTEGLAAGIEKGRKYVRALMSGGTFAAEAQAVFSDLITDVHSNVPTAGGIALRSAVTSMKNTVVDLGADEFTVGRPHPMIDYTVRKARIVKEAQDPETAVLLLDVVLGYGAHPDPSAELAPVIADASERVRVVCCVTGTPQDPQDSVRVTRELTDAGAFVTSTNAAACKIAGYLARWLAGK
jgi:succinyl-CoA synthetase alpha subunit